MKRYYYQANNVKKCFYKEYDEALLKNLFHFLKVWLAVFFGIIMTGLILLTIALAWTNIDAFLIKRDLYPIIYKSLGVEQKGDF